MEKKIYISPLMEVANISLTQCLLDGSPLPTPDPNVPVPPHPGAPARQTPAF